MLKKFNQLKQEDGESDAGECKWTWFEPCLTIWGKITKARLVALLEAWTMVFQLIRWVDLRRSLSTWRILKNMMLLLLQTDRFLPFAGNSSQGSKTPHTHTLRSATYKKPGVDGKASTKKLFERNCVDGRERKSDGAAKKVGRLCAHFVRLPPLSANEFEGAGR
jgi:hypothetical protein